MAVEAHAVYVAWILSQTINDQSVNETSGSNYNSFRHSFLPVCLKCDGISSEQICRSSVPPSAMSGWT